MNLAHTLTPAYIFETASKAAESLGLRAFVIGGFVRDQLLGRPSKDVDIVVEGDGIDVAEAFAALLPFPAEVITFRNFGTAMVRCPQLEVEFVGARKESYRGESRKPDVQSGTLAEDLARRDFTINTFSISLQKADFGTLLDSFDGQADLEAKMLRTPLEPNITFSDDPLRIMRGLRFAAQLGFDIEGETYAAMREQAPRLSIVSAERITDELNKLLMSPQPAYGLKLAFFCGVLDVIFPELVALRGVENVDGKAHKDNFFHTLEVLENVVAAGGNLWLRWAALLHDIAKPATKRFDKKAGWTFHGHEDKGARWVPGIFRRFRLPAGHEMRHVQNLVRLHLRPISLVNEHVTDSAVRRLMADAGPILADLMLLVRADVTTKNPRKAVKYLAGFDAVEGKFAAVAEADELRNFQPILTGQDIMEAYGLEPSVLVGQIKTQLREDLLDGVYENNYLACWGAMQAIATALGLSLQSDAPLQRQIAYKEGQQAV